MVGGGDSKGSRSIFSRIPDSLMVFHLAESSFVFVAPLLFTVLFAQPPVQLRK